MPKKSAADKKTGARNRRSAASGRYADTSQQKKKPRSINELLQFRSGFRQISTNLAVQQSWLEWLQARLAAELAAHLVSVVPHGAELVVFADSAAWGSRLRYALAALQSEIALRDSALSHSRVRVQRRAPGGPD